MGMAVLRVPEHARLAYVMRAGLAESVHYGSVVVLAPDGSVQCAVGDPCAVCYPRSAMKPIQASAMVHLGLELPPDLLALAAGSHSGEKFHIDGVRRILASHGLTARELRNPLGWPMEAHVRDEWIRAGHPENRLAQNCSGKHAAMLVTARANGWATTGYLAKDHPLQNAIAHVVQRLTGESIARTAVDGCGAPAFALSLEGLTRAIGRVASASAGTGAGMVAAAIRAHPEMLGGTKRPVTKLIWAVRGLIAKDGAEGIQVAAMPDGSAVGVKIADGSPRARMAVTAAALRVCGVDAAPLAPFLDGADAAATDGLRLARDLVG